MTRYAGFFRSLVKSPSYEVSVMAGIVGQDIRSTTGKNLKLIMELTGLDPRAYGSVRLKEALINAEMVEVPIGNVMKKNYIWFESGSWFL